MDQDERMLSQYWFFCALSFATFGVFKGEAVRAEEPDQTALLEDARRADPAALAQIYDQYADKIYAYIYHRVGQADLAEDLTGQVFMRMLESVRKGDAWRTSFSGWLYRIAHNLVIDHYRRRQRATFIDIDDAPPLSATEGDPHRSVEARLESEHLRSALGQLTEEQAEVITLRFLEELSIAEVATIMDKTDGAIKALQYRAVLALRRVMQT
jgi:RNA polymerase sigma-70 factor, ECF subfamily